MTNDEIDEMRQFIRMSLGDVRVKYDLEDFKTKWVPLMMAEIDGQLSRQGNLLLLDGTAANPSLPFHQDRNTGLFRSNSDTIGFSCDGVLVAELTTKTIGETPVPRLIVYDERLTTGVLVDMVNKLLADQYGKNKQTSRT